MPFAADNWYYVAMDEAEHLGRRLQKARTAAGMTQQVLCHRAHLSYSTLTKIERGAIKSPSIFTIQSIAEALGMSLDELMGGARKQAKGRSKTGISFVYFDINGCLVDSFSAAFTKIAEISGAPADIIETAFWRYNNQVCRGDMTMKEFDATFAREVGLQALDWQQFYLEAVKPIPGMDQTVRWASEHYRVGLLTNIMPGLVAALRESGKIPDIKYDVIIDSSEVRMIKPEPGIFELAAQKAACPGQEILFVDDSRTNLMTAQKQDWRVLWFNSADPRETIQRIQDSLKIA